MVRASYIWFNGKVIPWGDAKIHILSHVTHYGSSVFEGIRAYATPRGPAAFCLKPHIDRFWDSCKIIRMPLPYTKEQITDGIKEIIRANGHQSCYIRPIAFRGLEVLGVDPRRCPVEVGIATWEWGRYLGPEAIEQGIDAGVSSWRRMAPDTLPGMGKIGGQYINSQFIVMEATERGFVEGIALDVNGWVSEGSGENIFLVRRGVIHTPPLASSILPGVTREVVMTLAKDHGIEVRQEFIPREMLYVADEVFFTGTAAEITPVRSVDGVPVGEGTRGPITRKLQEDFFGITSGEKPDRHGWLTPVALAAAPRSG